MSFGINGLAGQLKPPAQPLGDALPQFGQALAGGVLGQRPEVGRQGFADEGRGWVLGFPDGEGDVPEAVWRMNPGFEPGQLLEGIGLEGVEQRIHQEPIGGWGKSGERGIIGETPSGAK